MNRSALQVAVLVWGAAFCLLAGISLLTSVRYHQKRRTWLVSMLLATSVLLGIDATAWIFRGTLNYAMVQVCSFLVFFISDVILFFFHKYSCCCLLNQEEQNSHSELKAVSCIYIASILLTVCLYVANQHDSFDFLHRNSGYMLSVLVPFCGMMMDFALLVKYRARVSKRHFAAMLSYLFFPLLAYAVQYFYHGFSLTNVAIAVSMMLIFVSVIEEQNLAMKNLSDMQQEIKEKYQIAATLNKCVAALSENVGDEEALLNLLEIIRAYFDANRAYIFEIDFEREVFVNTYEMVRENVSKEKDNLQEVPLETMAVWLEKFEKYNYYYIESPEQEKGGAVYKILQEQHIETLLAVPILRGEKIIGFLGVDDPARNYKNFTLLKSIQFFIVSSLDRKKQKEYLEYLSYRDMLTKLYNRNKCIEILESGMTWECTGVAYLDLNGLKEANDSFGHEVGDELIRKAAAVIYRVFADQAYRVGGDEFVVICAESEEEEFHQHVERMQRLMKEEKVKVSVGAVWKEHVDDLEALLNIAEKYMYIEKELYYETIIR